MPTVFVRECSYDYLGLRPAVDEILFKTTGDLDLAGKKILIKPNLLCPAKPEQAILTHPLVIKAVVEHVLARGGKATVSDSNATGSFDKIVKQNGVDDALRGMDVEIKPLSNSRVVETADPVLKSIELSSDVLDADVVINLPKLKTHSQMLLTLGVKNLFGCVVGLRKPEWHLRIGIDRRLFARLLILIHEIVQPAVTILDGVLAMEGDGPGTGGTPRSLGVVLGSRDARALDITVCRMLGIEPETVPTNVAAPVLLSGEEMEIDGPLPVIRDFRLPRAGDTMFGPRFAAGLMRRYLTQRPSAGAKPCRLCGECWKYCPAKAITPGKGRVIFDYDKCIRCYCCLEVCPHGALKIKEPLASKLVKRVKF